MITQIIMGAVGGLAYSLSGFAKKDGRESFDWKKMAPTIVIGAVVGGISGYLGQDYNIVYSGAIGAGVTAVVENFWKAIWRKWVTKGTTAAKK